jgi:DNA-directed RNA polymerase specialized sigma24 family protein
MDDKEFANKILNGDQSCWKEFMERYTDWVLYKAWEFERKFCRLPARLANCSLLLIMRQRKGKKAPYRRGGEDCDEGVELYLWLFQHLRQRLKSYRGESKLSTYIWTILNSKSLRVDILRWKYGRVDECNEKRLPVAIQRLPETERKIFVWLRRGKDEGFILEKLKLEQESFRQGASRVREALLRAGQLDLIERPEFRRLDLWDAENEGRYWCREDLQKHEAAITDQVFYRQVAAMLGSAIEKLKPAEQKLLKLYYHEGLSGKEIGRFCSQLAFPLEIDGTEVGPQNVYYLLGKVTQRLLSTIDLDVDGRRLSRKQWLEVLAVLGQEEIW